MANVSYPGLMTGDKIQAETDSVRINKMCGIGINHQRDKPIHNVASHGIHTVCGCKVSAIVVTKVGLACHNKRDRVRHRAMIRFLTVNVV